MVITVAYLRGAIGHAIKRARDLIEIAQSGNTIELRGLQEKCSEELNDVIIELATAQQALEKSPDKVKTVARIYQVMAKRISDVERLGVFSLKNTSLDDKELNRLLNTICEEIRYPLVPPTVSHTSQEYFEIAPKFNLMRVPLIEGRYLTQLADLYHELCHPLLSSDGLMNPRLKPLFSAFGLIKNKRGQEYDKALLRGDRRRGSSSMNCRYALWRKCWVETWCEEFICDAFGAFCAGPAYGWTNYHLCFRTDAALFQVPEKIPSSHPADDARMSVILEVLKEIGHETEAGAIEKAWVDYANSRGLSKPGNFELCYPPEALAELARTSKEAFEASGIVGFAEKTSGVVAGTLQDAWHMFWSQNTDYEEWEKGARETLMKSVT